MRVILFAIFLTLSFASVQAEPLSAAEQTALNKTRNEFLDALKNGNFDVIVAVIPPKIVDRIASGGSTTAEKLYEMLPKLLEKVMANVAFTGTEMVTENLDATKVVLDGKNYAWGFAPSSFEMTVEGQNWKSVGHTLALLDGGKWYLVRTSDIDKIAHLRAIYPFFVSVEFPGDTTTPVN